MRDGVFCWNEEVLKKWNEILKKKRKWSEEWRGVLLKWRSFEKVKWNLKNKKGKWRKTGCCVEMKKCWKSEMKFRENRKENEEWQGVLLKWRSVGKSNYFYKEVKDVTRKWIESCEVRTKKWSVIREVKGHKKIKRKEIEWCEVWTKKMKCINLRRVSEVKIKNK